MSCKSQDPFAKAVSRTLFVLGDFPHESQLFIHREMREMERLGASVNVLAVREIARNDLDDILGEVRDRTIFTRPARLALSKVLARGKLDSPRLWSMARRIIELPHRSQYHRARSLVALITAFCLAGEVKMRGYRYIHAHFGAYQTDLGTCLARLAGIPYGTTYHAYDIWRDRNLLAEKIAGARVVITCTRHNERHLKNLAPKHVDKIHRVYHGLDLTELPIPEPVPEDPRPLCLAVGRLIPKKGFIHLVDAAAILRDAGVPFRVTIVGDGPLASDLRRKVNEMRLGDQVKFTGYIPNPVVMDLMMRARVLAAPSVRAQTGDQDGLPNVILEAMAAGRPVVGSDISGLPEAVADNRTGILVPPGDAGALASAIKRLSSNRSEALAMVRMGRRLVEQDFDLRRNVQQQMAILAKACGRIKE